MSNRGLTAAIAKMREHGSTESEIEAFAAAYEQLAAGATGLVPESEIDPLVDPPRLSDQPAAPDSEAFAQTVMVRLNGGLGTSMGLEAAKSLLPVRTGLSFLDLTVRQVLAARSRFGVRLPLLLMNSFRTRDDALEALAGYPELPLPGLPLDFLQSQNPKIRQDDLMPVDWPADPDKEWCPPGHGEVFSAMAAAGILDGLVDQGFRYVSIANGDNLGATPSPELAAWFAATGAPFAMEVCIRTANDRKGGHLAVRRADGRLILRELAQTPPEDEAKFMDPERHRYFNTNNLWVDLLALKELMGTRGAHLGLPLIRNRKTVDPSDPSSPAVYQLESAMGAAIEVFEGATAIVVDRSRFLPVKTTNDLLLVRSDIFDLTADNALVATRDTQPRVDLDPAFYRLLPDFEARFPYVPSLRDASGFKVVGDWTFEDDVTVVGDVELKTASPQVVTAGTVLDS